jgi:hypothetical protein
MIQKRFISGWRLDGAKIFKNTGRRLPNINLIYGISGFWNAVSCVDLNGDGKGFDLG